MIVVRCFLSKILMPQPDIAAIRITLPLNPKSHTPKT